MKALARKIRRRIAMDVWLMQRPCTGLFVLVAVVLCVFWTEASYAQYKDNRELWGLQQESTPNNEGIPSFVLENGQTEQTVYHKDTETMHMVYFVKRGVDHYSFAHRSYSFATSTYTNAVASAWVSVDDDAHPLALSAAVDSNGDIGVLMAFGRLWTTNDGGPTIFHTEIRLYYDLFDPAPAGSAWLLSPLHTPPSPTRVFMDDDPSPMPPPSPPGVTDELSDDCPADAWQQPVNIWLSFDGDKPIWAIGVGDMYELGEFFFCAACACEPTAPDTTGRLFYARSPVVPGVTPLVLELNKEYVEVDSWTATTRLTSDGMGGFEWSSRATTGGVAFEEDSSGTAKIAYSTLGLSRNSQLMYATVGPFPAPPSISVSVLDANIETVSVAGAPTPKKRVRLVLDPPSPDPPFGEFPRVAYEKRRADGGFEHSEVWYVEPEVTPLFPELVLSRLSSAEVRVAEILMDSSQVDITGRPGDPHLNEDRTLQVVAYGFDLRGLGLFDPKYLVVSLPADEDADALTPWNREFGLNDFRQGKGIGAAIDTVDTGSVRVVGLRNLAGDDGFYATEASNLYVKLDIQSGTCLCPPSFQKSQLSLNLTGPPDFPDSDFKRIGTEGVGVNEFVLMPVAPPGAYTLTAIDATGDYTQTSSNVPTIDYSVPNGQLVTMTFTATCPKCSGCGAAPLYPGAVVLDSFGNALLPLVPALLALGVWAFARRRRTVYDPGRAT